MEYHLQVDRVKAVMKEKRLKRKALKDAGLSEIRIAEWIYRRPERRVPPSAAGLMLLTVVLEVPADWLMGAPSRYDRLGTNYRAVTIEGSLDFYLEQTADGRTVAPDLIPRLRDEINSADPPLSVDRWRARADTIIRAARWGQTRDQPLDQMVKPPADREEP